jgi:hypothetical protein
MGLETATYISGLVATNPVNATDPVSQGDDHLRLIKTTILNSFPNITGAMTASHTELNYLDGATGVTGTGSVVLNTAPTFSGVVTMGTALAVADGGTGAITASAARTNLGLGSISTQASSSVSITGGSISGITDLAIADGGTGASTAAAAASALGVGTEDSPTFTGATLGSAVLTGPSANRLEVGGRVAFIHDDTNQTSAEIFFSTAAPTTQGSNGDIYFEHEA